jgi:hypothetical protein
LLTVGAHFSPMEKQDLSVNEFPQNIILLIDDIIILLWFILRSKFKNIVAKLTPSPEDVYQAPPAHLIQFFPTPQRFNL